MNQAKIIGLGVAALLVGAVVMTHESPAVAGGGGGGGGADDGCGAADPNSPAALAAKLIVSQLAASNLPTAEIALRLDAEAQKLPKGSDGYCILKAAADSARGR